ncbi:membrane bound O-acyl transferase family-domain-containing protein [Apiospora arundinis]
MDSGIFASSQRWAQALPVISALSVQLVPSLVLAYVPASSTQLRRAALLVVAVFAAHAVLYIPIVVHNFVWRTTSAALAAILAFRSCDVLCLHPVGPEHLTVPKRKKDDTSAEDLSAGLFTSRLFLAWRQLWNMRGIGTRRAGHVTPFSKSQPDYVPTRGDFIVGHILRVAAAVIIMDFCANIPPENVSVNYSFSKQHLMWRLSEVDMEEIILRVAGTTGFWVNMACYIAAMYGCLAVLFVGLLGLDDPADWPPVFGSISNAWTIQRFWGMTWHQTLRLLLSANCDFVLLSVLRLPRNSILTKHARLCASFALSGALHHVVDALVGVPLRESGMFRFMVMQWIGILVEDVLAALWGVVGSSSNKDRRSTSWGMRCVGYAWVCLWLVWTSPSVFYPYTRVTAGAHQDHSMLPFTMKAVL